MTSFVYLGLLTVSLVGLVGIDHRHRLAVFAGHPWRTLITVAVGVAVFSLWDVVGIRSGVFFQGPGPYQSGLMVAAEFPVEELFFLTLLCYTSLLGYLAVVRWLDSRTS